MKLILTKIVISICLIAINTFVYFIPGSGLFATPYSGGLFGFLQLLGCIGISLIFIVWGLYRAVNDGKKDLAGIFIFCLALEIIYALVIFLMGFPEIKIHH